MMLLVLGAAAGAPPSDPVLARLAWSLRGPATGDIDTFRHRTPEPLDADGVSVVVEGIDGTRLARAGFAVEAEGAGLVQVEVPYTRLRELASMEGVTRVREPWRARPKEVVTEGYAATMANDWHEAGVDGDGVVVGVVDVGFRNFERLAREGPELVYTDFSRGDWTITEHGTAVTEIVYDFAPGADYYLVSFTTDVELAEVLDEFRRVGVDVVNGSIGFDNVWHADGTSFLTVTVDDAVAAGLAWFGAAGNENDKYRVGELSYASANDVAIAGEVGTWVRSAGGYTEVSFRWSEPFGSAGQDLDLLLVNEDGSECGRSEEYQVGADWPYEHAWGSGCSDWVQAVVYSANGTARVDGLEGYLYAYQGMDEASWTWTEDLTLPADTREGIAVGAYFPDDDTAPYYTSRGPTNDGRTKPDVAAPTGVTTVTYGQNVFEGSSAATPHAAGLGALWVSATGGDGHPDDLKAWMRAGARDLGEPGDDDTFGAGAIRGAEIPPPYPCGCSGPEAPAWAWAVAMAALGCRRR